MTGPTRVIVRLMILAAIMAVVATDSSAERTVVAAEPTDTVAPATTTLPPSRIATTLPPSPIESTVLWRGDVESGDVSQWRSVSITGDAEVEVVTSPVHSGEFALKLSNSGVDGTHNAGVRMNFQGPLGDDPYNLPDEAYYSAWFYVPFVFEGESNIFQFKQDRTTADERSRVMLWKIALEWKPDGAYDLVFATRIDQQTGEWQPDVVELGIADTDIPVGRWFQLETFYMWGMNGTGRTTVWLDGVEVWDQENMSTWANNLEWSHRPREWAVNHYLGSWQGAVVPADSWIFVDDLIVSSTRTSLSDSSAP